MLFMKLLTNIYSNLNVSPFYTVNFLLFILTNYIYGGLEKACLKHINSKNCMKITPNL